MNLLFLLAYTRVQLEDIKTGVYKNASYLTYHAHAEWTRQSLLEKKIIKKLQMNSILSVKYAEHLECFISCSTNPKTALVLAWMEKSGLTVRV